MSPKNSCSNPSNINNGIAIVLEVLIAKDEIASNVPTATEDIVSNEDTPCETIVAPNVEKTITLDKIVLCIRFEIPIHNNGNSIKRALLPVGS